jgi:hypothetical protein
MTTIQMGWGGVNVCFALRNGKNVDGHPPEALARRASYRARESR